MLINIEITSEDFRDADTRKVAQAVLEALSQGKSPAKQFTSGTTAVSVSETVNINGEEVTVESPPNNPSPVIPKEGWEFAAKPGRRRSKADIALHEKELELGRRLTPEEKGETDANVELADEAQAKAKQDTKNKARINALAKEGMDAAAKELAAEESIATDPDPSEEPVMNAEETPEATKVTSEEAAETFLASEDNVDDGPDEVMPGETEATKVTEEEATIPKTDDLSSVSSLFS